MSDVLRYRLSDRDGSDGRPKNAGDAVQRAVQPTCDGNACGSVATEISLLTFSTVNAPQTDSALAMRSDGCAGRATAR